MRKLSSTCIVLLFLLTFMLAIAQPAQAQPPPLPHRFYGSVTIDGNQAPPGTTVSARIGGVDAGSTTTDAQGRYGYSPIFQISGTNGAIVEFYVNGVKASQTAVFSAGTIENLNLTAAGTTSAPPPSALPQPPSSPPSQQPPSQSSQSQQPPPSSTLTPSISLPVNLLGQQINLILSPASMVTQTTTIASGDGMVSLTFRASTKAAVTGGAITVSRSASPPPAPQDARLIAAYEFNPSGSTFDPPLLLIIQYEPGALPPGVAESGLFIAYWDSSRWVPLSCSVDTASHRVLTEISHFSIFALLGKVGQTAPSSASFNVTELQVSPPKAKPGETVTIAATVSNTGGSQGTYKAVLKVNDIVQQEQNITLKPGETKLVTFTVSKQSAGVYRVQVGDKTASFSVTAAQSAITFPSWLPALLLAIGAVVLLVLIVIISRRLAG